jgi:hypothetical protein
MNSSLQIFKVPIEIRDVLVYKRKFYLSIQKEVYETKKEREKKRKKRKAREEKEKKG